MTAGAGAVKVSSVPFGTVVEEPEQDSNRPVAKTSGMPAALECGNLKVICEVI